MNSSPSVAPDRLEMRGIVKRFGATTALDGVDLDVAPGEVHALVGENGAGKSTLMRILAGAEYADEGRILIDGADYRPRDPLAARRSGVAMIHQEVHVANHLTVGENIMLGRERHRFGFVGGRMRAADIQATWQRLAPDGAGLDDSASRLGPAGRQLVEIARALASNARLVIMDEPTSSLGPVEIAHLFDVIDELRRDGIAVIYISHFLEEVQRVADRCTVLRDGRVAAHGRMDEMTIERLVEAMLGRRIDQLFPRVEHARGDAILELRAVTGRRAPRAADLVVHRGEIVGLAGLVGSGRTELIRSTFALDRVLSGSIVVAGHSSRASGPHVRLGEGIGMVSEDRAGEGLALDRSIAENLTLSRLGTVSRFGILSPRSEGAAVTRWIDALRIKARGGDQRIRSLSGGNQQKVAIARLLHQDADVFLLDEPTRGIDVGSKSEIYELIGRLAARGKAVIVASSSIPELLGLCDRIAVMHRGRLGPARPRENWTEHDVATTAATGSEVRT